MTSQATATRGPILLITDLSARCDRALDRAVQLAQHHNVKLIALHVIEPSFLSKLLVPTWDSTQKEHQQAAQQRLLDDLQHVKVDLEVLVEIGYPVDVIKAVSKQYNCSMVVSGTARDETLGRFILGGTVERVARESDVPLLVVRRRPAQNYGKILAGFDFSEGARQAVESAVKLIPHQSLTLFHSFDEVGDVRDLDAATIQEATAHLTGNVETFAKTTLAATDPGALNVVVQHGSTTKTLPAYVHDNHIELVVLGTQGLTGIVRTAMGSVAEQLLLLLRTDVLIVPTKR